MRTKKIIYTFLTILLLTVAFFAIGFLAPEYYEGEKTAYILDNRMDVWKNLTSLDDLPARKPNIESISVLEEGRDGIIWIENLKNGNQRTVRLAEREIPEYFVIEVLQSDNGLTGRWEYFLIQELDSEKTLIRIVEKSNNTNLVLRAWHTIIGRGVNLRREIKSLQVSLFQRLLTTP